VAALERKKYAQTKMTKLGYVGDALQELMKISLNQISISYASQRDSFPLARFPSIIHVWQMIVSNDAIWTVLNIEVHPPLLAWAPKI
jgi:hypothetical protein